MFDFLSSVSASDVGIIVVVFVVWACIDLAIVRHSDKKRAAAAEAKSFKNRKPTVLY